MFNHYFFLSAIVHIISSSPVSWNTYQCSIHFWSLEHPFSLFTWGSGKQLRIVLFLIYNTLDFDLCVHGLTLHIMYGIYEKDASKHIMLTFRTLGKRTELELSPVFFSWTEYIAKFELILTRICITCIGF